MSEQDDPILPAPSLEVRIIDLLRDAKAATVTDIATLTQSSPAEVRPTLRKLETRHLIRWDEAAGAVDDAIVTARGRLFRAI